MKENILINLSHTRTTLLFELLKESKKNEPTRIKEINDHIKIIVDKITNIFNIDNINNNEK